MNKKERKQRLIRQLAGFLSENTAGKSILLEIESSNSHRLIRSQPLLAHEWKDLLDAAEIKGYLNTEQTIEHLQKILS